MIFANPRDNVKPAPSRNQSDADWWKGERMISKRVTDLSAWLSVIRHFTFANNALVY